VLLAFFSGEEDIVTRINRPAPTVANYERFKRYPLRTCYSSHACCLCSANIALEQQYHDGGYGRRAHVDCVEGMMNPTFKTHEEAYGMAETERQRGRYLVDLSTDLGLRYGPARATLDTFRIYHPNQQIVVNDLRSLCKRLGELVKDGAGIVFYGTVGTGKDHLLAAMLYQAVALPVRCRWVNGQELFGAFRDRIDTGRPDEDQFRDLCEPQVLGISDPKPPVGSPGAWDVGNLYRLLDRRYRAMKSTWVSLNANSPEEADAMLSAAVFDRLREGAELFGCFWPSWRERKSNA
jgi:DNA replication protein DnaC